MNFKRLSSMRMGCIGTNKRGTLHMRCISPISNIYRPFSSVPSTNDSYTFDWLQVSPSWTINGSGNGIGSRVFSGVVDPFTNDTALCYRLAWNSNIPIDHIWSAFDNYLEFQSSNDQLHYNKVTHYDGPVNSTGEILEFDTKQESELFKLGLTSKYYEKLILKDDTNYIWQIDGTPFGSNALYSKYFYTARLYKDTTGQYHSVTNYQSSEGGCLIVTDIEIEFNPELSKTGREYLLQYNRIYSSYFTKYIYDYVLDKIGLKGIEYSFEVDVPVRWIYDYMSDWSNIKWFGTLLQQDSIAMIQSDVRTAKTESGMPARHRFSDKKEIVKDREYLIELQNIWMFPMRERFYLNKIDENRSKVTVKTGMYPPSGQEQQWTELFQKVSKNNAEMFPKLWPELYKQSLQ